MATGKTSARLRSAAQSSAMQGAVMVAAGLAFGQVLAYLLSLIGARALGPANYSVFASMLSLLMMGTVIALGVQAAGARRVVLATSGAEPRVARSVARSSIFAAAGVALATLIITPLIVWLLHLDGPLLVFLLAANLAPITIWGGLLGIAQGAERHRRLATIYAVGGFGRAIGGIVLVIATDSVAWTLAGMAIGTWIASAASWYLVRRLARGPREYLAGFRIEVFHASNALLALFVLTNVDVLLARHFLPAEQAGLYAAGAVVAKVAFWLPQFVATVAYPRMADHRRSQTLGISAAAVILIGLISIVFVAAFPNFVITLIGGSAYAALANALWLFAAIGATFALAQLLLYSQIAASKRAAIVVLWVAVVALVGLVWVFHSSVVQIATIVLSVAGALAVVGLLELVAEVRRGGKHAGPRH